MCHPASKPTRALAGIFVATVALAGGGSATAALSVCNKSPVTMRVAVAYVAKDAPGVSTAGRASRVEGWWSFAPGECAQILDINAGAHWVSFYAESKPPGRVVSGREPQYCVRNAKFEVQQLAGATCAAGWQTARFHRSDTGKTNHTFTIR